MQRLAFVCLVVLAGNLNLQAQIAVQVRLPQENFLVFEPLPVQVSIRNYSGRTIQLENTDDQPWLRFTVAREDNSLVPAIVNLDTREPVLVPAGQAVMRTVDLLPLFEIRERGRYRVQAAVTVAGRVATSAPTSFTLINGREIWTRTVGLPEQAAGPAEYRTYSLLTRREGNAELLFVGVREEPSGERYSLISVGPILPTGPPEVEVDPAGALHVLFHNGPRSFGYVVVDSEARVQRRAGYADRLSRPELTETNGTIAVTGGELIYPRQERVLTEEELNPPPPPPPPPKKKKWWQVFG
jgi:hypothetical protein